MATTTPHLGLTLEPTGDQNWTSAVNLNFSEIDAAIFALQTAGTSGPAGPQGVAGVAWVWAGPWNSATHYSSFNVVTFNGSTYLSIAPGTGLQPDTNTSSWSVLALAGAAGAVGPQGIAGSTGSNGAPGPTGATGATGPSGVAGSGAANLVLATPNGASGTAVLRSLVGNDIPGSLNSTAFAATGSNSPQVTLANGSAFMQMISGNTSFGADNPVEQTGDHIIFFSDGTLNTGALTIGPWANTGGGLRMDSTGSIVETGNLTVTGTVLAPTFETSGGATLKGAVGAANWPLLGNASSNSALRIIPSPTSLQMDAVLASGSTNLPLILQPNGASTAIGGVLAVSGTITVTVAGANSTQLSASNGSAFINLYAGTGTSALNGIIQANDNVLLYSGNGGYANGALVLAPYSTASGGLRLDNAGNVAITGIITAPQYQTSGGAIFSGASGAPSWPVLGNGVSGSGALRVIPTASFLQMDGVLWGTGTECPMTLQPNGSGTTVGGALTVTGTITASGNLNVLGNLACNSIFAQAGADVTVQSHFVANGSAGATVVNGLAVGGNASINGTLASGSLGVVGTALISGAVTIGGGTTINSALNVTGPSGFTSGLSITGATVITGTVSVSGLLTATGGITLGKIIGTATGTSVTSTAPSSATAVLTSGSTDLAGQVTINFSTPFIGPACTVNFGSPYPNTPFVVLFPASAPAITAGTYVFGTNTSGFQISMSSNSASLNYTFNYCVVGS